MSQSDIILAHLEAGNTITPKEAYVLVGSLALHSRIAELRHRGYAIDSVTRRENGKNFGEYFLAVPHG